MLKQHRQVIDGKLYTWTAWPALSALRMALRLTQVVGKENLALIFGFLMGMFEDQSEEGEEDEEDPTKRLLALLADPSAASAILVRISEGVEKIPEKEEFFRELCKHVRCDKVRIGDSEAEGSVYDHFDTHFQGNMMHMMQVLVIVAYTSFTLPQE